MSKSTNLQIKNLTNLSQAIAAISPELARYYLHNVNDVVAESMKPRPSSTKNINHYCNACYTPLIAGKTCTVEVKNSKIMKQPLKNAIFTNVPKDDQSAKKSSDGKQLMKFKSTKRSKGHKLGTLIQYKCNYCHQENLLRGTSSKSKKQLKAQFKENQKQLKLKSINEISTSVTNEKPSIQTKESVQIVETVKTTLNLPKSTNSTPNNTTQSNKSKKQNKNKKNSTLKSLLSKKDEESSTSTNFSLDDFLSNL